ncbi:MAG: AAA family ATPase [Methylococcales bacterium]
MNDIFITAIEVKKVRNIENFIIPLSETERKHLIITGKNGSGKTSLLLEINKFIEASAKESHNFLIEMKNGLEHFRKKLQTTQDKNEIERLKGSIGSFKKTINSFGNIDITFTYNYKNSFESGNYLLTFFESKRVATAKIPTGINKVELKKIYATEERINQDFIQYIVNLKAERSFAKDDNDNEAAKKIDVWFERFENQLKELFDAPDLQLVFDRKNYNFHIQIGSNEPFSLTELSDGYSAVLTIVTELILRMEATGNKAYDMQGVVLIDEIETHLHVALQKKIMPFLCAFFPNIQFIVTTHSPFVLSSISNAVICDLETREVITDLSGYSYDALVESYFNTDKYSEEVKKKLQDFEWLTEKTELSEEEQDLYDDLKSYFDNLPTFRADELAVKLQQIQLKKLTRKG